MPAETLVLCMTMESIMPVFTELGAEMSSRIPSECPEDFAVGGYCQMAVDRGHSRLTYHEAPQDVSQIVPAPILPADSS